MVVTVLHLLPSGAVASYPPSGELMELMQGNGLGWDDADIAREVALRMTSSTRNSWPGYSRAIAQEWAAAVGRGGLTRAEALDLFTRFVQERQGSLTTFLTDTDELPDEFITNRYFRDAIVWDDKAPSKCRCDMDRCRGIHMDQIRKQRDKQLLVLDVQMLRAIEAGDDTSRNNIARHKKALRDIPQTFDLSGSTNPADLFERWPARLDRGA